MGNQKPGNIEMTVPSGNVQRSCPHLPGCSVVLAYPTVNDPRIGSHQALHGPHIAVGSRITNWVCTRRNTEQEQHRNEQHE